MLRIQQLDYRDPPQADALLRLLDEYARGQMGGGEGLDGQVRQVLPERLAATPHALSALAWEGDQAVGLINCFLGFSTFKARPILNIHDIAVTPDAQGRGVGTALLAWAEDEARSRGCCKLSLEVLEGNTQAQAVYRRFGFAAYTLDPAQGRAMFWEKPLAP